MRRVVATVVISVVLVACGVDASGGSDTSSGAADTSATETGEPLPECEPDPVLGTAPISMPPKFRWQTEGCELATYYEGVGDVDGDGVLEILAHGVEIDMCPGPGEPGVCSFRADYCLGKLDEVPARVASHWSSDGGVVEVEAPGDVDGDGFGDFAMLLTNVGSDLVHGDDELATIELHANTVGSWLTVPGFAHNFDGNSVSNLVVAHTGVLRVSSLDADGVTSIVHTEVSEIEGSPGSGYAGVPVVAAVGDVDVDGRDDVAWLSGGGDGGILYGGDPLEVSLAEVPPDRLSPLDIEGAYLLGAAGDVNGDGHADLALAAERGEFDHRVYVVFGGPRTASATDAEIDAGEGGFVVHANERIVSLDAIGDFTGDGLDDLAIETSAHAHVIFGRVETFADDLDEIVRGCGYGRSFDQSASHPRWTGDLDGDGRNDLGTRRGIVLTGMLE